DVLKDDRIRSLPAFSGDRNECRRIEYAQALAATGAADDLIVDLERKLRGEGLGDDALECGRIAQEAISHVTDAHHILEPDFHPPDLGPGRGDGVGLGSAIDLDAAPPGTGCATALVDEWQFDAIRIGAYRLPEASLSESRFLDRAVEEHRAVVSPDQESAIRR